MASYNNESNINIDRDTQILVEYSRLYPSFSILSLRKIIRDCDGNRESLNDYLSKVNQRQTELKVIKAQSRLSAVPSIPDFISTKPDVPISPIKERKRHVSAPQHQIPRILVLRPNRSHNSCKSLSPDVDIIETALTPDSLDEGRISCWNKRDNHGLPIKDLESYDIQFYRLWKSISCEIDQLESAESSIDTDTKYVQIQHEEQKALELKITELINYRQFLLQFNQQLILIKEKSIDYNIPIFD